MKIQKEVEMVPFSKRWIDADLKDIEMGLCISKTFMTIVRHLFEITKLVSASGFVHFSVLDCIAPTRRLGRSAERGGRGAWPMARLSRNQWKSSS